MFAHSCPRICGPNVSVSVAVYLQCICAVSASSIFACQTNTNRQLTEALSTGRKNHDSRAALVLIPLLFTFHFLSARCPIDPSGAFVIGDLGTGNPEPRAKRTPNLSLNKQKNEELSTVCRDLATLLPYIRAQIEIPSFRQSLDFYLCTGNALQLFDRDSIDLRYLGDL